MYIQLNGEQYSFSQTSIAELLIELSLTDQRIAVEVNLEIVPRSLYSKSLIFEGDCIEIVHAIGGVKENKPFVLAGKTYKSRLLVGTGLYSSFNETAQAIEASGAEIVTVAVRRTNIGQNNNEPNLLDVLPKDRYTILPNTAGCFTAEEAVRTCRLARELLDGHNLVKLEVLSDKKTLFPNVIETLKAAQTLVNDSFDVMVYTSDDPIIARQLIDIGCVAVMPLAGLIGSGLGICNPYNLRIILEESKVPVLVDAGVGTASDATIAMELGCDAVLMNSAIARAQFPIVMAQSMRLAVESGRLAFCAGRMPKKLYASASSPLNGLVS
ncbi:UNVERIFIED_CONTAM: hypothetical protein GTU68_052117 [Idotea baltica]|nr:hypothetical protein [Idotea baltica]